MVVLCPLPVILAVLSGGDGGAPVPDFGPARRVLEDAIRGGAFPGCAIAVGTDERVLWKDALGSLDYDGGPAVEARTLYDLASLTKVVGTTCVVMALVRDGSLAVEDPVSKHVPEFRGGDRDKVTIEHLLTHSSGLPAWRPLYKEARGLDPILARIVAEPLEFAPGAKESYSDLGFILLGVVASRAGGSPLGDLERRLIFDPLGLRDTMRRPPATERSRTAPTEKRELVPGESPEGPGSAPGKEATGPVVVRGSVHDENAAAAGGLTGHAGLFSTAGDLSILAAELLRGYRGESRIFPEAVVRRFGTRRGLVPESSRALGWDTPSPGSSAGALLGPRSFGHTGFTGTSLWIDPERRLYVILLSNRVHPTRENSRILAVRRAIADAVVQGFEGKSRGL